MYVAASREGYFDDFRRLLYSYSYDVATGKTTKSIVLFSVGSQLSGSRCLALCARGSCQLVVHGTVHNSENKPYGSRCASAVGYLHRGRIDFRSQYNVYHVKVEKKKVQLFRAINT